MKTIKITTNVLSYCWVLFLIFCVCNGCATSNGNSSSHEQPDPEEYVEGVAEPVPYPPLEAMAEELVVEEAPVDVVPEPEPEPMPEEIVEETTGSRSPATGESGSPVILDTKHYVVKEVFFGTNRKYSGKTQSPKYYGYERGNAVEYGVAMVSIPKDKKVGDFPRPLVFWKLKFPEDDEKHIVLKKVVRLSQNNFFNQVGKNLGSNSEAVVFVHGFGVTFEEAAMRTGQLAYDLEFQGAPLFYSWPSKGSVTPVGYAHDSTRIRASILKLKIFLKDVSEKSGARTVHLIAHSMGNIALTNALKDLALETGDEKKQMFSEVMFTAPDVDVDEFKDLASRFLKIIKRGTLYASSKDEALDFSKKINGGTRAGDSGNGIVVINGMDSIDVSKVDTSLIGHSYHGDNKSVISDIYRLLKGRLVHLRQGLVPKLLGNLRYWVFDPPKEASLQD